MQYHGTQKIDAIGRLVLPSTLKAKFLLLTDDELEVFSTDHEIVLRRTIDRCQICGNLEDVRIFHNTKICRKCVVEIKNIVEMG